MICATNVNVNIIAYETRIQGKSTTHMDYTSSLSRLTTTERACQWSIDIREYCHEAVLHPSC